MRGSESTHMQRAGIKAKVARKFSVPARAAAEARLPHEPPRPQARRGMSQGKLTEAVEAAPTDKAARFRAHKAPITAGDDMFEGAKGTKAEPDRCVSRRPPESAQGSFQASSGPACYECCAAAPSSASGTGSVELLLEA